MKTYGIIFLALMLSVALMADDYSSWTSSRDSHNRKIKISPDSEKYVEVQEHGDDPDTYGSEKATFYKNFKDEMNSFKSTYNSQVQTLAQVAAVLASMNLSSAEKTNILNEADARANRMNNGLAGVLSDARGVYVDFSALDVTGKVSSALSTFSAYSQMGKPVSYKSLYLEEAFYLAKNYAEDCKTLGRDCTSEYNSYYNEGKSNYRDALQYLNHPPAVPPFQGEAINPEQFLDKPLKNYTKRGLNIDFDWAGVSDLYKYFTKQQILLLFSATFCGSGSPLNATQKDQLNKDIGWFLNVWPQAGETIVMSNNYDYTKPGYAENDWRGKQSGNYGRDYYMDEYGLIADPDLFKDSGSTPTSNKYYRESIQSDQTFQKQTGRYNNRSYGYRYDTGTNTTIKLTVGGKTYEMTQNVYVSPIVLDMDGDGKLEASSGKWLPHEFTNTGMVEFDMDGDGFVDLTEWVGPNDGILLVYEGKDVSVHNFFGDAGYLDGYEKLSCLDKNADKVLSGDELSTLSVWQDKNHNAKVDDGEITAVSKLGITQINVTHDRLVSSFVQNGQSKKMWDWYPTVFNVKRKK